MPQPSTNRLTVQWGWGANFNLQDRSGQFILPRCFPWMRLSEDTKGGGAAKRRWSHVGRSILGTHVWEEHWDNGVVLRNELHISRGANDCLLLNLIVTNCSSQPIVVE